VPNADTNDESVLVFEEAEKSVERALRRLAPSPGPLNTFPSSNITGPKKTIYYFSSCTKFYNGAEDGPGSKMCMKTSGSDVACYQNINGCPGDMTEYICSTTAAGADTDGTANLDIFLVEYGLLYLGTTLRSRGVTLAQLLEFASPMGTFLYEGRTDRRNAFAAAVPLASEEADSLFAAVEAQYAADSVCTAKRVSDFEKSKAQAQELMTELIAVKKIGEQLLTAMVEDSLKSGVAMGRRMDDAGTCPCYPWETTAKGLVVPGY